MLPSWVGDAVMATPALRALREHVSSGTEVIGVMQPVIAEVLAGSPWCDSQILFSKRNWSSRYQLVRDLRAAQIDTIVLLTNSLWTAFAAKLASIPRRIGYSRDGRGWLLTDSMPALRVGKAFQPVPAVDYYLELMKLLGCDSHNRRMELAANSTDQRLADQLWNQLGFGHQPTVVINSSGVWGSAKVWPADHVEQLAKRIVESQPWQVLLHCGPSERDAANAVETRLNHPRVRSMGRADSLPIALTKGVLSRAGVVVSTDSGPRHIAVALDRPVVGLYGPTDPAWTKTYNVPEVQLGVPMACRGCWQKTCPLKHNRCMRDLGVEAVYGAIASIMLGSQKISAA